MEIKLIQASEKDLEEIEKLARKIWNQYYTAIISQEQIDYMLDKMYSITSLITQIHDKKHQFYFIVNNTNRIGFLSIENKKEGEWFIHKFYLDQTLAKKGIGSKSFQLLLDLISAKKISLTVNRQNIKSINFYFKNGFKIDHVADFDIGNGFVMNDFVMVWHF